MNFQNKGAVEIAALINYMAPLFISQPHIQNDSIQKIRNQPNAGRRTKCAPVKSLDSSEFSSEFSDLKTFTLQSFN